MNRVISQIHNDLTKMLEKHIGTDILVAKESIRRGVCRYMHQFYELHSDLEFDITVEQDEDDENKLIINIDSKEDKE